MHRDCCNIYSTEVQRTSVSENTGSNLHIPLNPHTVYERARYLKAHRDLFTLSTCFFSRTTSGRFTNLPIGGRRKGGMASRARQQGGICGYLENSIWKLGCARTRSRARRRIKGGTNWINVLSGALRAQDGYTTVGFKLKRPWACRWHGSLRMFLSSVPEGAANFFNWNLATRRDARWRLWSVRITRYVSTWKSRRTRIECSSDRYFLSVCHGFDTSQ